MDPLRTQSLVSRPTSAHPSTSPSPQATLSNDDIEAIIQMATSARQTPDGRAGPIKDTRTQLFVGNLPYRVRWQDLKDLFRRAGTVLRADVSLGPDNRSRGYGTVLLATAEDAGRAIDMFHGYSWQTRILEVRPDRLPPDFDNPLSMPTPNPPLFPVNSSTFASPLASIVRATSPSRSVRTLSDDFDYNSLFGSDGSAASSSACRNLFVGNLPFHCQWQDLKDLFRQAGTIMRADVALGPDGRSRGFGTVVFATEQDAERAVKMFNGYEYNGRTLKVHFDRYLHLNQNSASPTHTTFQQAMSSVSVGPPSFTTTMTTRPTHITLPMGYHSEFLPPSGPSSPYDLYHSAMPLFSQTTQPHIQVRSQPQTELPPPQPLNENNPRLLNDAETLSAQLASVSIFTDPGPISSPRKSKSPSTSSTNRPPDSGGTEATWRDATPQAESQSHSQKPNSAVNSGTAHHPHHPGPISLPPPTLSFPLSPHTLSPLHHPSVPIHISPIQHPSMGSPLHHPSTYPSAHSQMVSMTPHGLPPITPSMPPFIFHPVSASPTTAHTPVTQMPIFSTSNFSPTVAMSPGAFWGRPGNPNPFFNPTVGAPVHMHSPDATRPSIGGSAYFYPTPGANRVEPTGYFDPVYFPPGAQHTTIGSSGLSNEILKDPEGPMEGEQVKDGMAGRKEDEGTPSTEGSVGDDEIVRSASQESPSGTSVSTATSWYNSEGNGDERDSEDRETKGARTGGADIIDFGDEKKMISRTQSMSGEPKPLALNFHKSDSDPPTRTTSSGQGERLGWPVPLISVTTQFKAKTPVDHAEVKKVIPGAD